MTDRKKQAEDILMGLPLHEDETFIEGLRCAMSGLMAATISVTTDEVLGEINKTIILLKANLNLVDERLAPHEEAISRLPKMPKHAVSPDIGIMSCFISEDPLKTALGQVHTLRTHYRSYLKLMEGMKRYIHYRAHKRWGPSSSMQVPVAMMYAFDRIEDACSTDKEKTLKAALRRSE